MAGCAKYVAVAACTMNMIGTTRSLNRLPDHNRYDYNEYDRYDPQLNRLPNNYSDELD